MVRTDASWWEMCALVCEAFDKPLENLYIRHVKSKSGSTRLLGTRSKGHTNQTM